jgi:3,4-dihydroxy 2-butanone 4-phosphate synthase/GTP cyclohydrolase II
MMMNLALEAFRNGQFVIVTDDLSRENEGDLIIAAANLATDQMAFMIRYTSGVVCVALENNRARALNLPPMVTRNEDVKQTAFTVSVDAKAGLTTGISAAERANTIRALADLNSNEYDFIRPGHVFPLRAVEAGLGERRGHTEAAVALCELTDQIRVAAIAEIVADDGTMARDSWLFDFATKWDIPLISINELSQLVAQSSASVFNVEPSARAKLPREGANWAISIMRGNNGDENVLMTIGDLSTAVQPALIRIHSECFTGEVLGSIRCECGPQLARSLELIENAGVGAVIYLRGHEGRGIGLLEKVRAYALQDQGMDTVDANISLGHEIDARDWGDAIEILQYLKLDRIRLLTNNPVKIAAVAASGIAVTPVPLLIASNDSNRKYLASKRDRMGHTLPIETKK